jgi:hypothetical protein
VALANSGDEVLPDVSRHVQEQIADAVRDLPFATPEFILGQQRHGLFDLGQIIVAQVMDGTIQEALAVTLILHPSAFIPAF